jgi:hypothetical protein
MKWERKDKSVVQRPQQARKSDRWGSSRLNGGNSWQRPCATVGVCVTRIRPAVRQGTGRLATSRENKKVRYLGENHRP